MDFQVAVPNILIADIVEMIVAIEKTIDIQILIMAIEETDIEGDEVIPVTLEIQEIVIVEVKIGQNQKIIKMISSVKLISKVLMIREEKA